MRSFLVLAVALVVTAAGCNFSFNLSGPVVRGSGVTKEEKREVSEFHGLEVSGSIEAEVTIGDVPSVTLRFDDNLLPLVVTEVNDGKLVVRYKPGSSIVTTSPQKLIVVARGLDSLAAKGASRLTAEVGESKSLKLEVAGAAIAKVAGLSVEEVDAQVSGASRLTLSGTAKSATIHAEGASNFQGDAATFEFAKVQFSGASRGEVKATRSIDADLSGASSLKIMGEPKARAIKSSGASSVSG